MMGWDRFAFVAAALFVVAGTGCHGSASHDSNGKESTPQPKSTAVVASTNAAESPAPGPAAASPVAPAGPKTKPDVRYVPTTDRVVATMLEAAQIKPDDVVYDLGCGDGRIVIEAARRYGVRAVGVEIDPMLVEEAKKNVAEAGLEKLVTIKQGDIFELDFSDATVVALYLLPELNVKLMPKLARLKAGSRIVSNTFDMKGAEPARIIDFLAHDDPPRQARVYLWVVPWKPQD